MDRRRWQQFLPEAFIFGVLLLLVGIGINALRLGQGNTALAVFLVVVIGVYAYLVSQRSRNDLQQAISTAAQATKSMEDVFTSTHDATLIVSPDGRLLRINRAAGRMFGYQEAELAGQPFSLLMANQGNAQDELDPTLRRENGSVVVRQMRTKDGRVMPVTLMCSLIPVGEGAPPIAMFVARDVSEMETMRSALETVNQRYSEAISYSRIAVFEYDARKNKLYIDASDAEALGALGAPADSINSHVDTLEAFLQSVPLEDHQRLFRAINQLTRGKETRMEEEIRLFLKNRGLRWYLIRGAIRAGTESRIVGMVMDVTARKATEIELQSRDAILQTIVHFSEVLLRTVDYEQSIPALLRELGEAANVSRVYVFTNHFDAAGTVIASQRHEWVGQGIQPQMQNPDLQDIPLREVGFGRWVDEMSQGLPVFGPVNNFPESEQALLEAQSIRSVLVTPIFVGREWWGFIGFDDCVIPRTWPQPIVATLQLAADIIGAAVLRNRVEKEMQTSRDFFMSIMKNLGQGVTVIDQEGKLVYANPAYALMIGKSSDDLLGTDPVTYVDDPDYDVMEENWALRKQGRTTTYVSTIRHVIDGSITEVMVTGVPRYVNGQLDGSYSVVTDVSDRRKLEEHRLALALEREKVTLMSDFVRDTSHDFRTPLSVIQTSTYLIRKYSNNPDVLARLDMIAQQSERMNNLLDSMLLAMELENAELTLLRLDLHRLMENCVLSQRERASLAHVALTVDIPDTPLIIRGEEGYLLKAATLLLDNALSFTPKDGTINVRVTADEDVARLIISDSGVGISEEDLPFIFQRMFRADRSRNMKTGGSGMGLSIVKRIIDLHGGSVDVESTLGEGSSFTVTLPRERQPVPAR
jgi:PAS domain S-box-containing protein